MKTKIYFLPIILLAVLVLSACGNKNQSSNEPILNGSEEVVIDSNEDDFEDYEATIEEMFLKGKSLKCLMSDEGPEGKIDIVYYIDGKKERFRAESKITGNSHLGGVMNSVSILKDGYSYSWDDLINKDGIKFKIEEDEMDDEVYDNDFGLEEEFEGSELDEKFNLKCSSWRVNEKMFDLPKDKSFKDISDTSDSFDEMYDINSEADINSDMDFCSFCILLPEGADRDECLSDCSQ